MANEKKNLKKYTNLLGLEISENTISCVEVKYVKNNFNITGGFRLDVPVFQDLNKTIALLKQNLKLLNIKSKECAIGLAMQYFKLFPVSIPKSIPEDEIDSIVMQEGNISLENDVFTWFPLKRTERQDADGVLRYDVLGVSLSKKVEQIVKYISKQCGFKPVLIAPSFFGLGVFLSNELSNRLISTLWLSQIKSEFVVWSGQEPIYEHLFLTHQISDQIFQSVNYIETQLSGTKVSLILTCGPYLREANITQLPYNFQELTIPEFVNDSYGVLKKINRADVINPLGISLSAMNFLPYALPNLIFSYKGKSDVFKGIFKEPLKGKTKNKPINFDPVLFKYAVISIFVVLFSFIVNYFIQNALMPGIQANESIFSNRIQLAQLHLAKVLNNEKANKIFNLKVDFFSNLIESRKPWSKVLREIGDMTPKGLWIDRLVINNNNVDVFGRALSVDSVANFSINLNYTAMLLNDAQIIALRKFQEEGIDIVEFQVSAKVKNKTSDLRGKKQPLLGMLVPSI